MAELVLDVLEQILVRLDGIDLLRCKKVCKSWLSLISSPLFVKAHLNYTCSINYHLPDKRIIMLGGSSFLANGYHIVGSSNGLVCISPKDVELFVTNPLTREVNYLPALPEGVIPKTTRPRFPYPCWGFGYDASIDDYKVVVGFGVGEHQTRFHVLALKSNVWKLFGDIKYKFDYPNATTRGILCEGSLHWFMNDRKNKRVILAFDLSLEEFKEIPPPDDLLYRCDKFDVLGFTQECLCIYKYQTPRGQIFVNKRFRKTKSRPRICMMRSYQVPQSWEQAPYPCEGMDVDPLHIGNHMFITDKDPLAYCGSLTVMNYVATPIFVESLVSPHGNITRPIKTTNDNKAKKRKIKTTNENKALKRKRRQAKNSKTSTVLYEFPKIYMLVIDPELRARYKYVLPNKVKLPTPDEKCNFQNGPITEYISLFDRDEGLILLPCKRIRISPKSSSSPFEDFMCG